MAMNVLEEFIDLTGGAASKPHFEDKGEIDANMSLCDPCLYDETNEEATGFCLICLEYLCKNCIKEHRKAKMTRSHNILEENIPQNSAVFQEIRKLIVCPFHSDMNIAYHCEDHDMFACVSCKADTHRKCENVHELSKSKDSQTVTDNVLQTLNTIKETAESVRKSKTENVNDLHQSRTVILDEARTITEDIIKSVKNAEEKFEIETTEQIEVAIFGVKKDLDESLRLAEKSAECRDIVETALKYSDKDTTVVIAHLVNSRATNLKCSADLLSRNGSISVNFVKSSNICNISALGKLTIEHESTESKKEQTLVDHTIINTSSDAVLEEEQELSEAYKTETKRSLAKEKRKSSFEKNVWTENHYAIAAERDAKYCSILGSVVLASGQVLIIDVDNSCLKLLSDQFVLQDYMKLPGRPVRMCAIGFDTVVITFKKVKRINRYKVILSSLTYEGGFNTTLYNRGISYNGNNIVALMSDIEYCAENDARDDTIVVQVLDAITGSIFETISDFRNNRDKKLYLKSTQALHITEENDLIIAEANRVTCFTYDKTVTSRVARAKNWYTCHGGVEKNDIENITSDKESIYVCLGSGKVLQMLKADYRVNRFLISNITSARSVSIDAIRGHIIVGCFDDDYIHVFSVG